ncbi:universal stress protein [Desulfobacula sp.]|uniref:oxidoreductase n=1 Tax=Desulfobacula sp. TaxID=2593537 RepID=UPI0026134926|nr:universal stress protein [Desulfobacula sp.]
MNQSEKQDITGYPFLFSPLKMGGFQMKNRLVALPVHTGFAYPDGGVSVWMNEFYARLAGSGVAMVVVANAAVSSDGVVSKFNLRVDKDTFIPALAKLAATIKKRGALACLQLNHAGRFAKTARPLLPSPVTSENLSFNVESLKDFMEFFPLEKRFSLTRYLLGQLNKWRQAMTSDDRNRVIEAFGMSAARACEAGFDMVELHGASGYLLCQYLSSFTNKIEGDFGGTFQGRTTFPLAVIQEVKKCVPTAFPVGFRIILREWVPDGIDLPEALAFAQVLEKKGIAYLSASAGTYNSIFSPGALKWMGKAAYLSKDMAKLTARVRIPTITSGRIITPSMADKLIGDGVADLIGLGRSLRADPQWVAKAMSRDKTRHIATCKNCNWCLKRVVLEQGFNCSRWPEVFRERTALEHQLMTRNYKPLWVIADTRDIQIFKQSLPILLQGKQQTFIPAVLILKSLVPDQAFDLAQKKFVKWMENIFDPLRSSQEKVHWVVREHKGNREKIVQDEIGLGDYGRIFIGSNPTEPWRDRLLYEQRGKVMVRLCANNRQDKVMVPVDLSPATLLVMIFLRKTLMQEQGFCLHFVHVLTGKSDPVERQWAKMKKITDFDLNTQLVFVRPKTTVVSTLVAAMATHKYGTVIMGKRGLSGIKRWLLGSVSAGVLRHLTDQTLFLID